MFLLQQCSVCLLRAAVKKKRKRNNGLKWLLLLVLWRMFYRFFEIYSCYFHTAVVIVSRQTCFCSSAICFKIRTPAESDKVNVNAPKMFDLIKEIRLFCLQSDQLSQATSGHREGARTV